MALKKFPNKDYIIDTCTGRARSIYLLLANNLHLYLAYY